MKSEKNVFIIIGVLSALIISFLFWLIYFKAGAGFEQAGWVAYLPALNAILNTITAALLITGYWLIKNNHKIAHRNVMIAATMTSALFLISYITYHHYKGDTKFLAQGYIRPIYFFILLF